MRWFGFGAWWLQSERPPQDVSTIPNTTVTQIRFFQETCSLVFRKSVVPPVSHANQSENLEEPEEDSHPIEDPEVALQRSRHGRTLKPRRDPDFDYSGSFLDSGPPLNSSNLHGFDTSFALLSVALISHANTDSSPLIVQCSAFPRLRKQLREAGERLFYVEMDQQVFEKI